MTVKFGINWIQGFQKNMKSEEKSNLPRNYRVIISNYIRKSLNLACVSIIVICKQFIKTFLENTFSALISTFRPVAINRLFLICLDSYAKKSNSLDIFS